MTAAETGVYITLIAMMYERGGAIAGADNAKLARLCGTSASAFKVIIESLISDGKITRIDGQLFNRRVELEIKNVMATSEVARDKANVRWQKKATKTTEDECSGMRPAILTNSQYPVVNKEEKNTPIIPLSGDAPPKADLPRAKRKKLANGPVAYSSEFELFWDCYPPVANQSKAKASEAFHRLDKPDKATATDGAMALAAWLETEKQRKPDADKFIPHASTWLNGRRWETLLEQNHRARYEQRSEVH